MVNNHADIEEIAKENQEKRAQLRDLQEEISREWDEPKEASVGQSEGGSGPLGDLMKVFESVRLLQENIEKLTLDADQLNKINPEENVH